MHEVVVANNRGGGVAELFHLVAVDVEMGWPVVRFVYDYGHREVPVWPGNVAGNLGFGINGHREVLVEGLLNRSKQREVGDADDLGWAAVVSELELFDDLDEIGCRSGGAVDHELTFVQVDDEQRLSWQRPTGTDTQIDG
ncbi:MAG: hypothetical protein AAFO29_23510, partial [Actinomycetota bacterium]